MKHLNIRTAVVLTACITLNTGCMMAARAVAQQRQPDPNRIFDSADTNGDGIITREEFLAARQRLFARFDRNSDGSAPLFERADTDHNGELSKEEVAAAKQKLAERRKS